MANVTDRSQLPASAQRRPMQLAHDHCRLVACVLILQFVSAHLGVILAVEQLCRRLVDIIQSCGPCGHREEQSRHSGGDQLDIDVDRVLSLSSVIVDHVPTVFDVQHWMARRGCCVCLGMIVIHSLQTVPRE
jgi:hypothetical protein